MLALEISAVKTESATVISDNESAVRDHTDENSSEELEELLFESIQTLIVFLGEGSFELDTAELHTEEESYAGKLDDFKTLKVSGITHKLDKIHIVGLTKKKSPEKHRQFVAENRKRWMRFLKQFSCYEINSLDLSNEIPREFYKLLRDHIFDHGISNVQQLFVQSDNFPDEFNGLDSLTELSFEWDAPEYADGYTHEMVDNILVIVERNPSLKELRFCRADTLFANLMQILPPMPSFELHFDTQRKLFIENNTLRLQMEDAIDNSIMGSRDFKDWPIKRIEIELLSLNAFAPSVPFFSEFNADTLAIVAMHKCGGDIVEAFVRFMEYLPNNEIYLVESIRTLVLPYNGSVAGSENLTKLRENIGTLKQIFPKLTSLMIKMSHRFDSREAMFVCPYRVISIGSQILHCNPNPSDDEVVKKPTTKMPNAQRKKIPPQPQSPAFSLCVV